MKKISIDGFQLFDNAGMVFGRVGPVDSDWQLTNWSSLTAFEQSLLNSTDDVSLANTAESTVRLTPYPNPVRYVSYVGIDSDDSVKFKLVIVDEEGNVSKKIAQKIKGSLSLEIDMSDRNIFPSKKSLRYYYSFSATGKPHFKVGYGDIKICDVAGGQDVIAFCF